MNEFSSRLKKVLEIRGMNQSDFARRAGITTSAASRYINASREPNTSVMRRICKSLGVSADYLLGTDGAMNNFDRLLILCQTAGLTTEQRMILIKVLSEDIR